MRREPHVRFCERAVVKFRRATHRSLDNRLSGRVHTEVYDYFFRSD
jgi:hypothetical protein